MTFRILHGMLSGKVPLPSTHANVPSGVCGRQGAAAECALYTFRGRAAADTDRHWLVCKAVYAAYNKRGKRRERM